MTKRKSPVEDAEVEVAPEAAVPVAAPDTVLSSVTREDTSGELAATVKAAPAGSVIVLRDGGDVAEARRLLKEAKKQCGCAVDTRIGPRSLWRNQRSPA